MATTQIRGSQILDSSITTDDIQDGSIKNIDIASDAGIAFSKLSGVASVDHNHDGLYAHAIAGDLNGFENREAVTISWSNELRTITLSGSFIIWSNDNKYSITGPVSLQIADVEGNHYIYFNENGQLAESTTFSSDIILKYCYVAALYWDGTNKRVVPSIWSETHGVEMPSEVHAYLHATNGTTYISGMALSLNATGTGTQASHCQFTSSAGIMRDEDITHSILARLNLTNNIPVLYRSGSSNWRVQDTTPFPVINTGSGRAAYNQNIAGIWQLTEVANGWYVNAHIYAIPGINHTQGMLIAIIGQQSYSTITTARAGAASEALSLNTSGLPVAEFVLVGTCLIQTSSSYNNVSKSRFVEPEVGYSYIDWRTESPSSSFSASSASWGNITGALSTQLDLQQALDAKVDIESVGVTVVSTTDTQTLSNKTIIDSIIDCGAA